MSYVAAANRYDAMTYERCGRSGLLLPAISLGLWHNFGGTEVSNNARAMCRHAFDLGITHFDLANNYGSPYGSAERNFGAILAEDFAAYRDELIITTKAGWDMWPGPYGNWGSRKYLLASLDQSLKRTGLDYVDIFYSHRFDPETPLAETMGALATAVRQGKALYAGISAYPAKQTREAISILADMGTPLLVHQPPYSMFRRSLEGDLLDVLGDEEVGVVVFSPLAQGLLTDKYLRGIPAESRAADEDSKLLRDSITDDKIALVAELNKIAQARGQSLAQMALAWVLRHRQVTSAIIGASSIAQIDANVASLENLAFDDEELNEIDRFAIEQYAVA